MTPSSRSDQDDLAAVRSLLGPADPVPDPTLARDEVLAARSAVGRLRAPVPTAPRPGRGRFVVAGAVAALSVVTLVALVAVPSSRDQGPVDLSTGPGAKAVSSAYAATAGSGTARLLVTVGDGGGHTVTVTGVGDFDSGAGRAEISLVDDTRAPASTVSVVRTSDAIFARLPNGTNPLAADKPWVSVDAATQARLTQMVLGDFGTQVTGAPLDALAYLKAVTGEVAVVGPDTTRGEATTHYRAAIDPQKVVAQLPATLRPQAADAARIGGSYPVDLWIDGEGRLRKLELTVAVPAPEDAPNRMALANAIQAVTVELWDFGTPVEVTAPPADQVVDVGGLLSGFLGGAKGP